MSAETFVSAAVSVVLPWSTWPIVPTLQWGLKRLNFSLAMGRPQWLEALVRSVARFEAPRELASARSRVCVRAGNQRVRWRRQARGKARAVEGASSPVIDINDEYDRRIDAFPVRSRIVNGQCALM